MQPLDILILSNGPGEVTTWVRPVVKALRQRLGDDRNLVRISVMLSPCPHATGKEAAIADSYPEVDRVQASEHFFSFLLRGKTAENWHWRDRGVVLFLGGDQLYPLLIAKRLHYRSVVYAECEARWYRWIDRFGVMNASVQEKVAPAYRHKVTVVGDLMTDVASTASPLAASPLIGLLPGSKPGKLSQGVPLCLAIAQEVHAQRPQTRFILPVAPTLELSTLAHFADPQQNPLVASLGGVSAQLTLSDDSPYLQTSGGLRVDLVTEFPAYDWLAQCHLVLTTIGANTAELGALGIPMIVLLPTQQLDAMRNWDGILGILAKLPLVGSSFAKGINTLILKRKPLFAWPNIWAGEEIVPELIGKLTAQGVAEQVIDWLDHPDKLAQIRDRLLQVRGSAGAAAQMAAIIGELFSS